MSKKRSFADMQDRPGASAAGHPSPFLPMFEGFKAELDEHHDRRERVIKASRDITAASKKIIFSLQRVRGLGAPVPENISNGNKTFFDNISTQLSAVAGDLQGINAYRYTKNVSGGAQEYIEAASFQYYLATAQLLPYELAAQQMRDLHAEGPTIELSVEDYILGIYDMTGELMRFAITAIATNGELPSEGSRNVLSDLRELRAALEGLRYGHGPFASDANKKLSVTQTSVEKVEKALYGLIVRGAERPKGWIATDEPERGVKIEVEG